MAEFIYEDGVICEYPAWIEARMRLHGVLVRESVRFLQGYDKPMTLDGLRVVKGKSK
jgi:hypothetical protein